MKRTFNDIRKSKARTFSDIAKYNPYHDKLGRFTTSNGISVTGSSQKKLGDMKMYNRDSMKEIKRLSSDIIENGDFETYGIRIQEEDTEKVGTVINHNSSVWDDGKILDQHLEGVSTIDVNEIDMIGKYSGYIGKVAYLLGTNDDVYEGNDVGEIVMNKPTVIAKYTIKNGKVTLVEMSKTNKTKESKHQKNKSESAPKLSKADVERYKNKVIDDFISSHPGMPKFMAYGNISSDVKNKITAMQNYVTYGDEKYLQGIDLKDVL